MEAAEFRKLFLLDPDIVFLNHGSFGACPATVFEKYQAWQRKLEWQPAAFLDPVRGYAKWMLDSRKALGAEIGAHADDLVGVTNATNGLNVVAQSLPLQEGDEILTTDHEYAALDKTWDFVCHRTGAKIVRAQISLPLVDAAEFTQTIIDKMTTKTKILFLSHITSPTALVFPLEEIVAEAGRRGIWTVVDGAHSPAHIALDLDGLGADFYSGNCHKWLMSPKGAAFLHVRHDHQAMINPSIISHGWDPDRTKPGPFGGTAFIDSMEMQGTRDPAAWLTVPVAIEFHHAHAMPEVRKRCQLIAWETAQRVVHLTGLPPLSSAEFTAPQMVAMPVPRCDPEWLKQELLDRYNIEIPVFDWQGRTIVRLSVQCYNTQVEMDTLVDALNTLLIQPHKD